MSLLSELKRRNVFRVALFYVVSAWLVIQVAETILPMFDVPDGALRAVVVILALGFPVALIFAWVFELTPEGLKRETDPEVSPLTRQQSARKLNWATLAAALLAIGLIVVDRLLPESAPAPDSKETVAVAPATPSAAPAVAVDKSIAVLPFSDFSPGGSSRWFADGLSEEILNALVRVPDLKVAARTSSFSFRDSGLPIPEIATALGVAHVLEGSVRMSDDRVRVTAQLIRASDGFHIWSNNFDRESADMIGIQEDLARQISTAMETTMDPEALAAMAEAGTRSVEAYATYIRGLSSGGTGNADAYALFEQARALDPGFAAAHFRAALYWQVRANVPMSVLATDDLSLAEMRARLEERIAAAIRTADDPVDATLYRAIAARHQLRLRDARRLVEEYVTARPGDFDAWILASNLALYTGDMALFGRAQAYFRERSLNDLNAARRHLVDGYRGLEPETAVAFVPELVARWPEALGFPYQAQRAMLWVGRIDEARQMHDRYLDRPPPNYAPGARLIVQLRQACAEGRLDDARSLAESIPPELDATERWLIAGILSRPDEATAALAAIEAESGPYALVDFLTYPQFDARLYPSLVQVLEREGIPIRVPQPIPFACPPSDVSG